VDGREEEWVGIRMKRRNEIIDKLKNKMSWYYSIFLNTSFLRSYWFLS
jgi:hypothetical protein